MATETQATLVGGALTSDEVAALAVAKQEALRNGESHWRMLEVLDNIAKEEGEHIELQQDDYNEKCSHEFYMLAYNLTEEQRDNVCSFISGMQSSDIIRRFKKVMEEVRFESRELTDIPKHVGETEAGGLTGAAKTRKQTFENLLRAMSTSKMATEESIALVQLIEDMKTEYTYRTMPELYKAAAVKIGEFADTTSPRLATSFRAHLEKLDEVSKLCDDKATSIGNIQNV